MSDIVKIAQRLRQQRLERLSRREDRSKAHRAVIEYQLRNGRGSGIIIDDEGALAATEALAWRYGDAVDWRHLIRGLEAHGERADYRAAVARIREMISLTVR